MSDLKNLYQSLKLKHLLVGLTFVSVLTIRMVAASLLEITKPEAQILFEITRNPGNQIGQASILYQTLTIPLIRFFGSGNLVVRFWPVLAASILILLPIFLEDIFGSRPAVFLAFMLALDPFLNANAIQINGSALTIFCLALLIVFMQRRKFLPAVVSLIGFMLSGATVLYGLLLALFFSLAAAIEKEQNLVAQGCREIWEYCRKNLAVTSVMVGIIFAIIFVLGIRLSDLFGNFLYMFRNLGQPYAIGNAPQLYPVALLSYIPFGIILLLIAPGQEKLNFSFFLTGIGMLILLVCIALNPGHQILDLVWISLPAAILGTFKLDGIATHFESQPARIRIYTLIFSVLFISLALLTVMVIYQYNWGLSIIDRLLSLVSLFVMIAIAFILLAYSESVPLALTTARVSFLVVLLVIQAGFTWRALGLNGNPAGEILWDGYFNGAEVVNQIVDHADFDVVKTRMDNHVAFFDYSNPAVEWNNARRYPTVDVQTALGDADYTVIITTASDALEDKTSQGYVGQKFSADSYPLWVWQPLKSVLDSDYWFWLIFRQGQMYQEFNYIWVNQQVF